MQPAAKLNLLVMTSFALLFTPLAARLFARGDKAGISELYWRTAAWIAVFSFPVFALTSRVVARGHGRPVRRALRRVGADPRAAGVGYYFNAALGFNGLTLRVFGLVRYTVLISVARGDRQRADQPRADPALTARSARASAPAPRCSLHNVLKQAGLRRGTGISILDREHVRVYGAIVAISAVLVAIHAVVGPAPATAIALVSVGSAALLWVTRDTLHVGDTFPELRRIPLLGRVVG